MSHAETIRYFLSDEFDDNSEAFVALDALVAERGTLVDALEAVEWAGYAYDGEGERCPLCGGRRFALPQIPGGHESDCLIAAALAAVREPSHAARVSVETPERKVV